MNTSATADRIDAELPQTQCTRCGYPDCRAYAQAKAPLIDAAGQGHLVLKANHPSPLSALKPQLSA